MTIDPPEDLAGVVPVEVQAAVGTARWFAAAARELQDARGVHDTVQHIVELVADLAEADLAVVIGLATYGGLPQLLAATDYAAGEQLVALQRAAGAAPAWQVILDGERLQVDDLDADQRWPSYGAQVVDTLHFRSVLAFPLLIDGRAVASLAVYGRRPKVFGVAGVEFGGGFRRARRSRVPPGHPGRADHQPGDRIGTRPGHRGRGRHHHGTPPDHPAGGVHPAPQSQPGP